MLTYIVNDLFQNTYVFLMCMSKFNIHYEHIPYVHNAQRDQKMIDPWEVQLQTAVSPSSGHMLSVKEALGLIPHITNDPEAIVFTL